MKVETFSSVHGVEVFRPGDWHGRIYTNDDMLRIAANSQRFNGHNRAKLRLSDPAIKLGSHEPASEFLKKAAFGAVANFYTKPIEIEPGVLENRVYADISNVPPIVANALQFFPERSVEKYKVIPDPDTKELIEDVITSVAFLGVIPPEVKKLAQEYAVLFEVDDTQAAALEVFQLADAASLPTAVIVVDPTHGNGGGRMFDKEKVKAMLLSGDSDEEILKAFPGMTPADLQSVKDEMEKKANTDDKKDDATTAKKDAAPTPAPAGFSEDQAAKMIRVALEKQRQEFDAKMQAQREEFTAESASLKARAQKAEAAALAEWYDGLKAKGLPASFDSFAAVTFAQKLDQFQVETFSDDQRATMQDQFKAMLEHFAATTSLTTSSMVDPAMKQGDAKAKTYKDAVEEFAAKHPDMDRQKVFYEVAKAHPEAFEVKD